MQKKNIDFIINIAGSNINEYVELAKICEKNGIKGIELNLSCPNVKNGCLEFGKDEETLYKLVSEVRNNYGETLIVKLSSNVSFPEKIAETAEKAGADAISAINTVKAMNINFNKDRKGYKFIKGGMSGTCIKPAALNFIYEIRNSVSIPIIGTGGISSLEDMLEFFAVGADAVQIGTANFTHPNLSEKLVFELREFMRKYGYNNLQELTVGLRNQ